MQDKDALDTFLAAFVFVYLAHDAHFVTTDCGGNNHVNKEKTLSAQLTILFHTFRCKLIMT